MSYVVSKDEFAALVELALEELPEEFAEFLEEVPIEIRDHPTPRQLKRARVPRNGLLLGSPVVTRSIRKPIGLKRSGALRFPTTTQAS